jgi:hypothetical protein
VTVTNTGGRAGEDAVLLFLTNVGRAVRLFCCCAFAIVVVVYVHRAVKKKNTP